jgi:hypothetical protein
LRASSDTSLGARLGGRFFSGISCVIAHLLLQWRRSHLTRRAVDADAARGLVKEPEHTLVECFEPASLGRSEAVVGKREAGELQERRAHALEPLFELHGKRTAWLRAVGLGPYDRPRFTQERCACGRRIARAIGGDQSERFAHAERMQLDCREQQLLFLVGKAGQRLRQRRTDGAVRELLLQPRREPKRDRDASRDPALLLAEQARSGLHREAVLLDQRSGDLRLVERCEGARRRVRDEQEPLLLDRRTAPLDDGRHASASLATPALEALETVDDLERAVRGRHDAQRQIDRISCTGSSRPPGTQPGVARVQQLEREHAYAPRLAT